MYAKTLLMDILLAKLQQDTLTLDGVSQETIDVMVARWLIVEFPKL